MNIGEAAALSGVSAKLIRYYERIGLIGTAARSISGYRTYKNDDIERLRFIRRARGFGFSMEAIQTLLGLWNNRKRQSAAVKALALSQIDALRQQIADMQTVMAMLEQLTQRCRGDGRPDCAILNDLARPSRASRTTRGKRRE